ncbi:UNVERIFIED_CONTAM: WD40 repeat protein [Acetivibrio alkalicellulosi]
MKYQRTIALIVIILLTTTIGVMLYFKVSSMSQGLKTLTLPPKEDQYWNPNLAKPRVKGIKEFKTSGDIYGYIYGYLGKNKILIHTPKEEDQVDVFVMELGLSIYDPYNDSYEKLILEDNEKTSLAYSCGGISPDKSKAILLDEIVSIEFGKREPKLYKQNLDINYGLYIYDIVKESNYKITDLLLENTRVFRGSGWSDDGRCIIYCLEKEDSTFDFFIYDIAKETTTKHTIQLTLSEDDYFDIREPRLSGDGRYIFFLEDKFQGTYNLYKIDLNKEKLEAELLADYVDSYQVLREGRNVVFNSGIYIFSPIKGLFLLDTETKDKKLLSENYFGYDISPDGKRIVYSHTYEDSIDIRVATLCSEGIKDSTSIYRLVNEPYIWRVNWNYDCTNVLAKASGGKNYIIELEY